MDVVFKELSRLHETGNFSVLLTIVFMFTLYVLAILLAKRADRRDNNKVRQQWFEKGLKFITSTSSIQFHAKQIRLNQT